MGRSIVFNVATSCGRATCRICNKKILKGQQQIKAITRADNGWLVQRIIHSNPYQCDILNRI